MTIPATALFTALSGLLLVALSVHISMLRMRRGVSIGDGGDKQLTLAVRTHGNTAEHVPIFLLLSLVYELTAGTDLFLAATGAAFLAARVSFAWGLLTRRLTRRRQVGALVTYFAQAALALGVLWHALAR